MRDEKPCDFGSGRSFEVPGETPASAAPCEGALDDPASWQKLEAFDARRSLDDLDPPWPGLGDCINKLIAAINAISHDMAQLWEATSQLLQQRHRAMTILNVGRMNVNREQKAVDCR